MPDLEDASDTLPNDGLFNGAYDDDKDVGAVANFNNMDNTIVFKQEGRFKRLLQHSSLKVWVLVDLAYGKKGNLAQRAAGIEGMRESIVVKTKPRLHFLLHYLKKRWYVHQLRALLFAHPTIVYKVIKALYGLHQAPRAWYETLSSFLMENGFRRGTIDKTLFIKKKKSDIMLVQVYVDDIIFGSTKKSMCTEFEDYMHKRFQMSSMGELTFFLGLQVKQQPDGIFISRDKYVANILKKFDFLTIRTATTPIESNKPLVKVEDGVDVDVHVYRYLKHQPKLGLWYPRDSPFELEAFSDSDYGGASLDRKSTTEYVAAANCCGVIKNPVAHSKTKHIEIRFHFIRDCYKKRLIEVIKIHIDSNVADLLTKGFDVTRFNFLVGKNFSGKVTPLFDSMLVQQTEDEEGSSGNHGGQSSSDRSLSGNEDGLTLQSVYDLCEPSVHKYPAFDDLDDDEMDYMETKDAQDEGRTSSKVLKEKESADKEVSTKAPVSIVKPNEGTNKRNEGKSATQIAPTTTSTPTPTIFGDDETIAQVLITMSQNKQNEKEKGVEIRNVEDTERPRPTSTRSVLTLKPFQE
ncbi:putative ribonuclease H-like domain-containing protein [Tanacetum coccineum]